MPEPLGMEELIGMSSLLNPKKIAAKQYRIQIDSSTVHNQTSSVLVLVPTKVYFGI